MDAASPPLWWNTASFSNHCTGKWDVIYPHDFRLQTRVCAVDNSWGWWGPILETFEATHDYRESPQAFFPSGVPESWHWQVFKSAPHRFSSAGVGG